MFFKVSQNSQENTCTRVSFLIKLQAPDTGVFKNTFFIEQIRWLLFKLIILIDWKCIYHMENQRFLRSFTYLKKSKNVCNIKKKIQCWRILTQLFEQYTYSSNLNVSYQKEPSRGVLRKRWSVNMQQIYRRTPLPKCYFNKVESVFSIKISKFMRRILKVKCKINRFGNPSKVNIFQYFY